MAKGRHINDTIQIRMGIAHPRSRIRQTAPVGALSFSPLLQDILGPLPSIPPPFVWFLRHYLLCDFLSYLGSFATAKNEHFRDCLTPERRNFSSPSSFATPWAAESFPRAVRQRQGAQWLLRSWRLAPLLTRHPQCSNTPTRCCAGLRRPADVRASTTVMGGPR